MPPITTSSSDEAYRQAGVDLDRADAVVEIAKRLSGTTPRQHVLGGIGGFSGAFELPPGYRQPVLLSACDGVGTKLKLAFESGIHDTVGIDLVAMNVNDILASGGRPLVFLDYLATGKIQEAAFEKILTGIAEGCRQSDCALLGGETAEMPGFYPGGEYDLAGFCVGIAEKENMFPQKDKIADGDVLIGLASSGLHSNGYSLVRKLCFGDNTLKLTETPDGFTQPLGETLLTPTRIYVKPILKLLTQFPDAVKAMAHITGGGLLDNVPRVLPKGLSAEIDPTSWELPPVFKLLATLGSLDTRTMLHTFNAGIGFVVIAAKSDAEAISDFLKHDMPELAPRMIGEIKTTPGRCEVILT